MDADSLYQRRVKLLYRQPNTVRGRCIVWYAESAARPIKRVVLAILLTLFVGAHMVLFAVMILQVSSCLTQKLQDTTFHKSIYVTTLPLILLASYGIVLPPTVVCVMLRDIQVKAEGFSCWHSDSLGLLAQRFVFAVLCLASVLIFDDCYQKCR